MHPQGDSYTVNEVHPVHLVLLLHVLVELVEQGVTEEEVAGLVFSAVGADGLVLQSLFSK